MDNIIRLMNRKPNNLTEALIRGLSILSVLTAVILIALAAAAIMMFPLIIGQPWIFALYILPAVLLLGYLG